MYQVELTRAAKRALRDLPRDVLPRIDATILALAEDPRPHGHAKLRGEEHKYRVRVGDYRVLYQIEDDVLTVLVVHVGHRREVYRRL